MAKDVEAEGQAKGPVDATTTVFFSYSRADQKAALPIINLIEKAGYRVWWDGMLEGGTSFLETTEEALESAKAVVVLWSETSVKSHWVRDEAMSGRVRERLIPLTLDGTIAPLGFRQVQLIDFSDWREDPGDPAVPDLLRALAVLHERAADPAALSHKIKPKRWRPLSRRAVVLGAGGLGLGILGGTLLTQSLKRGPGRAENSIAVLPFENLGGDEDGTYLSAGLAADIRAQLARNASLQVVAGSSSSAIAEQSLSAKDMARALGVAHILEGSVRVSGNNLQVATTLIDGVSGFSQWTRDFSQTIGEALLIRQAITEALISHLTAQSGRTGFNPRQGGTQNAAAYNEYLKGDDLYQRIGDRASNQRALSHFDRAVQLDPAFGSAHAVRAQLLLTLGTSSADLAEMQDYFSAAKAAAEKAVQFAPDAAEAHSTLGFVRMAADVDIAGARTPYERSRELGYGDSAVLARYAVYMIVTGQIDKAQTAITHALELDPLNPSMHNTAGLTHYAARRFDKAVAAYRRVQDMAPEFFNIQSQIGLSLIRLGQIQDGLAACDAELNDMERLTCLAIGRGRSGDQAGAQAAFDELIDIYGAAAAYQQVQVLAEWGEIDAAMDKMRRAVELRDSGLTLAKFDPALDNLRAEPAFSNLLAQFGF